MSSPTKVGIAWWVFVAIGFAAGVLLCFVIGKVGTLDATGTGKGEIKHPTDSFTIRGDIEEPVTPGSRIPVNLALSNRYVQPIAVTELRIHVDAVHAPQATASRPCTVGDFVVGPADAQLEVRIPASATRTLAELGLPPEDWPMVGMLDTPVNQDGCKGASLTLSYSGSGRLEK